MRRLRSYLALVAVFGAAACATIVHGTRQTVGITSTPTAATVYDNGAMLGKTPLLAELTRKHDHRIRIELDGYQPYEIMLTRHLSGWVFGNLIFGGIIGIIIDAADGAIYKIKREAVSAALAKASTAQASSSQLVIAVELHPQEKGELLGYLVPQK